MTTIKSRKKTDKYNLHAYFLERPIRHLERYSGVVPMS